ncbi:MAG TPA: VOC family protein [Candidatus Methylomirabilis sp.]|nr:VOC family protein [Candidatus Methylomirabilis sp.]
MDVDHIVYGVTELGDGITAIEGLLGVRPAMGGKHVGLGTHNALLSLGDGAYLEIIAPDPEQPRPSRPLPFGLDGMQEPRLVAWAVKAADIQAQAEQARAAGVDVGQVLRMNRERPDGTRLEWSLTYRENLLGDGLVPFLIAWEPGAHPSETSPGGCLLVSLRAEHPEPERIAGMLSVLGVQMEVAQGDKPALVAMVQGAKGRLVLR